MPNPSIELMRAALIAACACATCGCAAPRATSTLPSIPSHAARAATAPAVVEPLDAESAAARAIALSPRVAAAAHRLEASARRAKVVALPPDPSIAIGLGVPIDGMGGFPISLSIMEGLGWLLVADDLKDNAERERALAARELVAASVEIAAEARRLVRSLDAARTRTRATARAADARTELLGIERAALELGESTPIRTARLERLLAEARLAQDAAALEERALEVALASLLAVDRVPALAVATEADARPSASTTLAVIRAHARVVRAESMLALAQSPLGSSAAIGASIQRDMEDRDWLGGMLEFSAPLFRREHELAAIRAEVAAERAELAEAERMAALEAQELELEADTARRAIEHARTAARAAADARAAIARAAEEGEASRVELVEADAEIARAQAMEASQRIGLAGVVARIESRTATPETAGVTEGVAP